MLEDSISNALIAVEMYNKPRLNGRLGSYIVHMNIAWTKAFHAYFYKTIGDRYYYKNSKGKYQKIDGEKKAWELKACMDKYNKLSDAVYKNILFFIKLRNKIEHTYLNCSELEIKIFGECQSLLYNYENFIIKHFGEEYAINTSLAFALQFSQLRNEDSFNSSKKLLSKEMIEINDYIDKYRDTISLDTYESQEYSIKLVQIPVISNTNKNDLAIKFLDWNKLSDSEKNDVKKVIALVKPKYRDIINLDRNLPGVIVEKVKKVHPSFNHNIHSYLTYIFSVKPSRKREPGKDCYDTNTKYCIYDQSHKDYQYTDAWTNFIIKILNEDLTIEEIKKYNRQNKKLEISEYE